MTNARLAVAASGRFLCFLSLFPILMSSICLQLQELISRKVRLNVFRSLHRGHAQML